jgi:hypothetical protein
MNRRTFLRTTGLAAASVGVAGCTGDGGGDGASGADVSASVVRNAPENPAPAADAVGPVTHQESDVLLLENLLFQRAGEKGLVVAGDATNDGDRPFEELAVEVTLYDQNDAGDDILDSVTERAEHDRLDAGDTWQWAATFDDEPAFEIDRYSVESTADYVDETEQDG